MDSKDAVKMLCEPHHAVIGEQNVEREALLDLLYQARYSTQAAGSVGSSNRGLLINAGALAMYENFDAKVRSKLEQFGISCIGDIKAVTERLHNALVTVNLKEGLDPREFNIFYDTVNSIEDLFDPPKQKELLGRCPECGESHVYKITKTENDDKQRVEEKELVRALVSTMRPGHALQAECLACGKLWVGQQDMLWLARHLEAKSDWDTLEMLGIT